MFGHVQVHYKDASEDGAAIPEKPELEPRVSALEADVSKMKSILERLEPKITEILLTGAKQAELHKVQLDVAEVKGSVSGFDGKLQGFEGKLQGFEGKLAGFDGRLSGFGERLNAMPSTWTLLSIVFATWGIGSALLVFTMTRLLAK